MKTHALPLVSSVPLTPSIGGASFSWSPTLAAARDWVSRLGDKGSKDSDGFEVWHHHGDLRRTEDLELMRQFDQRR